jgi:hypothetical protein
MLLVGMRKEEKKSKRGESVIISPLVSGVSRC